MTGAVVDLLKNSGIPTRGQRF